MNIEQLQQDEIIKIWKNDLWNTRTSEITTTSSMKLDGGYDMRYHTRHPYLWGIRINNNIIAVQSGHICTPTQFRIRGLWVHHDYRNKGVARKLFSNAEQTAKSLGCSVIWSYPRDKSLGAYIACGYQISSGPIIDTTEHHSPYWYVFKRI